MKVWLKGIFLLFIFCGNAMAVNQQIELKADWNLISFAVQPANTNVEVVLGDMISHDAFSSIWTYDAESDVWSTYPSPFSSIPDIDLIETGKGYWLKVTRAIVEAGKLLDIDVLDHLVIGGGKFVSLKQRGLGFSEA